MIRTLPLALTFLTIFPWPRRAPAGPRDLALSMLWFPGVGALLGLVVWGALEGLLQIFPAPVAAALTLGLLVAATRGLHLDGLADTADGVLGGATPEARLRIMKDSRVGAFGVMALVLVLLLKYTLFSVWAEGGMGPELLLFTAGSRWGMVLLAFISPYARPEGGLGRAMTAGVTLPVAAGATASALVLAVLVSGLSGVLLLVGAGLVVWLMSLYFRRVLGGVTGDVLGAANEVLEVLLLAGGFLL